MILTRFFEAQLEREAAISRRVLDRVPDGRGDWKPHERSMTFGYLAFLVASMPSWVEMAIIRDELDLNPPGGSQFKPRSDMTSAELRETHDGAVAKALAALRATRDEHLKTPWRLLVSGTVVNESPRQVVIADTFTHLAHHRGQLTVYLRLAGAMVPSIYGPSADDRHF
jgi:uncharacterized damage-inducible protein DinB